MGGAWGCPYRYGQIFQPRKTKPLYLWAPKSFITQIAKMHRPRPHFLTFGYSWL